MSLASNLKLHLNLERITEAISRQDALNPPNNLRWPCSICNKNVLNNQKGVRCDSCDKWCHVNCDGMSDEYYLYLQSSSDDVLWHCLLCTVKFHHENIPFTLSDNSEIEKINLSDSMSFCETLPSLEVISLANELYDNSNFEQNIPSLLSTKYYSVNTVQKLKVKNNLNIFHSNVNGLESKFDNLHQFLSAMSSSFDIIAITETSQHDEYFTSNITLEGYADFSTPTNSEKGGALLYVNSSYNPFERQDLRAQDDLFECVWVEIPNARSKNIICGSLYRHPKYDANNIQKFLSYFEAVLTKLNAEDKEVYLCGDFNINLLKIDTIDCYLNFYNLLCCHGFLPLIIHPTRVVHNQEPSLIDNIFSNNIADEIISGNIYLTLSEHFSQFASVKRPELSKSKVVVYSRDFSKFSESYFRDDVSIQSWNMQSSDSNHLMNDFFLKLEGCADRHAPIKKLSPREIKLKSKPWITTDIVKRIKYRDKLFERKKRQPNNEEIKRLYNLFRNRVSRDIKKSKKSHYSNYFNEHKDNIQKIWQGIRSIVNTKSNSKGLSQLDVNGSIINDPKKIANHVNNFFVNVGPDLDKSIPRINHVSPSNYLKNRVQLNFLIAHVSNDDVIKIIQSLPSKGTGPTSIPLRMLKVAADLIAIPLCYIINISFTTGVFPDALKVAKVLPLHKGGSTQDTNNFRPISLLSIFDKIMEKLMHNRLYEFLESHDILYKNQFGFRKKNSTIYALLEITEKIKESIDNGNYGCGIFIDLKKAFDTVNHKILLTKLEHYGIRGIALKWFESYLTNRKQFVFVNGESSEVKDILCGVPQGSVLGPLLFLLYINDLPNVSEKLMFYLFADDTNIYFESKSLNLLEKVVNEELKHLSLWLKVNRLALNIQKTNFLIFRSYKKPMTQNVTIKLDKKALMQKDNIKYLGVLVDEHLSWKQQISNVSKKVSRSVSILFKLRYYMNTSMLKGLYYSLVYSHLVYGIEVWGSACDTNLDKIIVLQKKAIRVITFNERLPVLPGPLCSSTPLFSRLELLKFHDIFKFQVSKFVFLTLSSLTPSNFNEWFKLNTNVHNHNTTSNSELITEHHFDVGTVQATNKLHTKGSKLVNYGGKQLKVVGPLLWNSLPSDIRDSKTLLSFKFHMKKHLINQYHVN